MRKVTTTESEIVQFRQDVQTKLRQRVREAIETVLDEELAAALGCEAYQRCKGRRGYRNGSEQRPLTTEIGTREIRVPRGRLQQNDGTTAEFRSELLPRYARRTKVIDEAILGIYLAGANSRRIRKALEPLLGTAHLSKSAVSRVVARLKRLFESWNERDLCEERYAILYVDGFHRLCCNFRAATSGWTTFGKHCTGSPIMPSDNPFKWRQFEPALILQCVRWYLRYALSYRDLEDMMRERGLCVDHTTIYRWVQRYAPEIDKRCRPFLRRTNDSYRIDETYVRVAGAWTYLYRGVDSNGDTLDFLLRATRDRKAAIAFFRKTLGAAHTTPPRVVTVDKNPAYPVAFEAVRHEGLVRPRSNLRQCKYLNNIIEQDHRFIKRRTRPMLGFKRFTTAWRTLRGIEIMHALRKGQARWMAKGDVVGQTQLIHKVFGLAA